MQLLKNLIDNEKFNKFIPLISVVCGSVLGVIAFYFYPGFLPADNVVVALMIGAASGWAATGANQTLKQLAK